MYKLVEMNIKESHVRRFLSETFSLQQVKIALELTIFDYDTGELTVIDSTTVDGDEAMEIQQLQAEDWVDMSILTDGPPIMHGNAAAGFVFDPNDAPSMRSGQSWASLGDCSFARLQSTSESRGLAGALNRRSEARMNVDEEHDGTQEVETPAPAHSGADSSAPLQAPAGGSTNGAPTVNETAMGPDAK